MRIRGEVELRRGEVEVRRGDVEIDVGYIGCRGWQIR